MEHETIRTLAALAVALAQIAALAAGLLVFWWAFKLLEELTRCAGRIAEDVQAIRSQTAQTPRPPNNAARAGDRPW